MIGYQNSHLSAGQTLSLKSGGDTTLSGAVAKGQRIEADIGGNLTLQSLQDRDDYRNQQLSGGISGAVAIYGSGGGMSANVQFA
ncbi:hemagglutinin repeat-containing protein, partial [Chitinivorax tropicus]|uniref:hemagglutinin repeat-containing protein n=1 Tax=Chitinivorax tropicus TaxID=714531 RepID=UPI001617843F